MHNHELVTLPHSFDVIGGIVDIVLLHHRVKVILCCYLLVDAMLLFSKFRFSDIGALFGGNGLFSKFLNKSNAMATNVCTFRILYR